MELYISPVVSLADLDTNSPLKETIKCLSGTNLYKKQQKTKDELKKTPVLVRDYKMPF